MDKELEDHKEDIWIKIFGFTPSFKQYQNYLRSFSYQLLQT